MIQNKINQLYTDFIYKRTYSRWREEDNRRESWLETVDRYKMYLKPKVPTDLICDFHYAIDDIFNMSVMPSMRLLWSAGAACDENNLAAYNCAYIAMDTKEKFGELLYVLMHGCGVGYSVERQYIGELPSVPESFQDSLPEFIIDDSKLGWKLAYDFCIRSLFEGYVPKFDYTRIRPKGARLKTFGGRASGPAPLKELIEYTIRTFKSSKGRKLNSIEVHDICCMVANAVVVGGVRRSACISFSNLSDQRMKHAKDGQFWIENPQRAMANNSIAYTEKPDCGMFIEEWLNLMRSGSGERGIVNVEAIEIKASKFSRKETKSLRLNPCQPAFATVLTPTGIKELGQINIGDYIWSGNAFTKVINKWFTGNKPVYEYATTSGSFIGTENHRIVQSGEKLEVKDATAIDRSLGNLSHDFIDLYDVMDGLVLGDGSVHKASNSLVYLNIGAKDSDYFTDPIASLITKDRQVAFKNGWEVITTISAEELPKTYDREIPERFFKGTAGKMQGFLRGLFSANGSICGTRVTLKQTSIVLIKQVQQMLSALGIASYITTNKSKEILFSNGVYVTKQSYDLNITQDREIFKKNIGFIQKYKQLRLDEICATCTIKHMPKITYDIKDRTYLGDFDVFDITVEAAEHTYWTGGLLVSNCGEAVLRDRGLCNLTEIIVKPSDTEVTLHSKIRSAVLLGCLQSTLTYFPNVSEEWINNAEEERLLGVSLTGTCDNRLFVKVNDKTKDLLKELRDYALQCSIEFADALGIPHPKQVTLVKPSGTVSQLVNCSSGLHPRYDDYYIRRVRVNAKDPVAKLLINKGVPFAPEVGQELESCSTYVFDFPMKSPRGSINRHAWTAIEQLEYWSMFNEYWCDGNPSVTIYVAEDEWVAVGAWVYKNWRNVCGLSFLPKDGSHYPLAPYEEIDATTYHELIKNWKDISIDMEAELPLFESSDNTEGAQTLACSGSSCELT